MLTRVGAYEVELVDSDWEYQTYQFRGHLMQLYLETVSAGSSLEIWKDGTCLKTLFGSENLLLKQAVYDVVRGEN